jgi:hypothetical protein
VVRKDANPRYHNCEVVPSLTEPLTEKLMNEL